MSLRTLLSRFPAPGHLAAALAALLLSACGDSSAPPPAAAGKPALTVTAVAPSLADWPLGLTANGDIAAWQEAVIGAEIGPVRITAVTVNVGDRVRRGQVLARLDSDAVAAELAQSRAAEAEAEAAVKDAAGNAERARRLQAEGFYSAQTGSQYSTGEETARARLAAAQARTRGDRIRLAQTEVRAPDDGIVSARAASVGTLAQPGQELFRLIRGGRLEWRAKVAEAALGRLRPGLLARLTLPDGRALDGRVRALAPSIDAATRDGLVYVDLAGSPDAGVRAGMFASGRFELGQSPALSLPQAAVLARDGFSYVFRLDGPARDGIARVVLTKVEPGRRLGDRIEIVTGLAADARVVASGAGFLADGDSVRLVAGQ